MTTPPTSDPLPFVPTPLELKWNSVQWCHGLPLPEVGESCEISGSNADISCNPDRAFTMVRVIGYTPDGMFGTFQKEGCWPFVERLSNCWFRPADIARWNTQSPAPSSDPSTGDWRMLEVGEVIQEGDEWQGYTSRWRPANAVIGRTVSIQPHPIRYRRRVVIDTPDHHTRATDTTPLPPPTSLEELARETYGKLEDRGIILAILNAEELVTSLILSALTRAVGTLQGDKARLDWLEKYVAGKDGEVVQLTESFDSLGSGFYLESKISGSVTSDHPTLRDAIDAAMLTAANDQRKGEEV